MSKFALPLTAAMWGSAAAGLARRGSTYVDTRYPLGENMSSALGSGMATRRNPRGYGRRRTRQRRRRFRGVIRRRLPPILQTRERLVRLKCVMNQSGWTSTDGALVMSPVSMFDITDPFVGNSTAQPLGYDQWKTLYNNAFVVGVKLTIRVHNTGTVGVMYGITPMPESQATTALTSIAHYLENRGTKGRMLSPEVDHGALVHKIGTARHVSVRKLRDEDTFHVNLTGDVGPARTAYYHLWMQPLDGSTTLTCNLVVQAEYLVRLINPVIPARSNDS